MVYLIREHGRKKEYERYVYTCMKCHGIYKQMHQICDKEQKRTRCILDHNRLKTVTSIEVHNGHQITSPWSSQVSARNNENRKDKHILDIKTEYT